MKSPQKKNVVPDGGWGYMVVCGTAIMAFLLHPVVQNFGLLFRPIFSELELSASEVTTIINVNSGAGYIFGMFHGPLTKVFGYRKYAMIGVTMFSSGLLATSFSYTLAAFMIFYGILSSIGFCITQNAFVFSLNSYFSKKRTAAVGMALMIAGVGSIITPLIQSKAISHFGARYTAFLMSGVVLNVLVAAMLLQPVEWHYKSEGKIEEGQLLDDLKPDTQLYRKGKENLDTEEEEYSLEKTQPKSGVPEKS